MNNNELTREEIEKKIDDLETAIFMEKMADFMDWDYYYKKDRELDSLKRQLLEMKGDDDSEDKNN